MTNPKERRIIFPGPDADAMIRAVLKGSKARHSWLLKPQPREGETVEPSEIGWCIHSAAGTLVKCLDLPYSVGQRLWCAEAWCSAKNQTVVGYRATAECGAWMGDGEGGRFWLQHGYILESPAYRQCFKEPGRTFGLGKYGGRWRLSTQMPRWASRIDLEVTGIQPKRFGREWNWVMDFERVKP